MSLFEKFDRHSDLSGKMATTLGVDLVGAATNGMIPETAIRTAVFACMRCEKPDECAHWLEAHAEGADRTPEYCRNKPMLERLRKA